MFGNLIKSIGVIGTIIVLIIAALFLTYFISQTWNIIALLGVGIIFLGVLSYVRFRGNPVRFPPKMAQIVIIIGLVLAIFGYLNVSGLTQMVHPLANYLQGSIPSMNLFGGV